MARWVTIPEWIKMHYSEGSRPSIRTVRKWCREGRIYPLPRLEGRSYVLDERACYVDPSSPSSIREARRIVYGTEAA